MAKRKKESCPRQCIIELLNETIYPGSAEAVTACYGLKDGIKELRKHINGLKRYKRFYDHIQSHLTDGQQVICKICNKTYLEIVCPASAVGGYVDNEGTLAERE